jgi:Ca2+-binding RTX toxin-like protein
MTARGGPVSATVRGVERFAFVEGWAVDFLGGDGAESLEATGRGPLRALMGGGDDHVWGTSGDDYIDGGAGTDVAYAGAGDDTCVEVEERSSC